MAKKTKQSAVKPVINQDLIQDFQQLLEKYPLDFMGKTVAITGKNVSLKKTEGFVCVFPCVIRYEVITLPNGSTILKPYCDCSG